LDSHTREDLHKLFFKIRDNHGVTFVIVTHDRDLAQMSDRCLEMRDGLFV
jgi:lipoprotein-releasing system ATP-binding protein